MLKILFIIVSVFWILTPSTEAKALTKRFAVLDFDMAPIAECKFLQCVSMINRIFPTRNGWKAWNIAKRNKGIEVAPVLKKLAKVEKELADQKRRHEQQLKQVEKETSRQLSN